MKSTIITLFIAYSFASVISASNNQSISNCHFQRIVSDSNKLVEMDTVTLELEFLLWGCDCPNWISITDNLNAQNDSNISLIDYSIYLQSFETKLEFWDSTFNFESDKVIVKGSFLDKEGFPFRKDEQEEPMKKARVFEFFEIKIEKK